MRGEAGILLPGLPVMAGYYNMPEKTAETIDAEGWLHTGDLATMDEQGYVNIVGRLKEMVIRGGENIFPREVRRTADPPSQSRRRASSGRARCLLRRRTAGGDAAQRREELSEQELRDYCKEQISHQKIPRYIQFVKSYPMTASGKVQKFVLREQAIETLGLEEVAKTKTA